MDDIIGGALKKDATDCHVTVSGTELIWREEPMFVALFIISWPQIMWNHIFKAAHIS